MTTKKHTSKPGALRKACIKWCTVFILPSVLATVVAITLAVSVPRTSAGPLPELPLSSIEGLAEIAAMKLHVSDIVTAWDDDWKGAWLVQGDGLLSVDLELATVERSKDTNGFRILLPPPKALQCRVDHERTEFYGFVQRAWWPSDTRSDLRREAMTKAAACVESAVAGSELVAEARRQCELIIAALMAKRGYACEIRWTDELNGDES